MTECRFPADPDCDCRECRQYLQETRNEERQRGDTLADWYAPEDYDR